MSQVSCQKQQQPLDTLQSMINGVLIETGKALRAANLKGVKAIGYTHDRLQTFLPNAIDKFHLALDELEIDIVRAKAVLSRDLRELQARQYQLDNPTMSEVEIIDAVGDEEQNKSPRPAKIEVLEIETEALEASNEEVDATENPKTMNISTPKSNPMTPSASLSKTLAPPNNIELRGSIQLSLEARAEGFHTDISDLKNAQDPTIVDPTHGLGITLSDTLPSATPEAPVTTGLQGTALDSMFDTSNNTESDLNFDFGFSGDGAGDQNDDFGGSGGEFDLSSFGNQANNDSGDPSSLLQGLGSFGDGSGGDFSLLDMSNNATGNNGAGETAADEFGMSGGDLDMALGMGANESTFDDLLDGMDFGDGDDNDNGSDIMEHGEFDDAFFGLNSDG